MINNIKFQKSSCAYICLICKLMMRCVQIIQQSMADPATAAWLMFGKPELENGIHIDDELKKKLWWKYKVLFSYIPCICLLPLSHEFMQSSVLQIVEFSVLAFQYIRDSTRDRETWENWNEAHC
jgi:hypothetical protein